MTQQTALDRVSFLTDKWWAHGFASARSRGDRAYHCVRMAKIDDRAAFSQALKDPRFIAYCKEQDRKEEAPGTNWRLSDKARKEIEELERHVQWL